MYTEVFFRAEVDKEAFRALRALRDRNEDRYPDHPFFKCWRAPMILHEGSYMFPRANHCEMEVDSFGDYHISFRGDLKNYENEIETFFDWVTPHCRTRGFIGYSLYEESWTPTLYYAGKKWED